MSSRLHHDRAVTYRIEQLLRSASDAERGEIGQRMAELAFERGLWIEVEQRKQRLPFAMSPWILSEPEARHVHALAWQLRTALVRLCELAAELPAVQQLLPLDPRERAWIERYRSPAHPGSRIFCRLDALLQRAQDTSLRVQWIEPNVVGTGGLAYSAALEGDVAAGMQLAASVLHGMVDTQFRRGARDRRSTSGGARAA